jgi:hypothetical protein
MLTNLRHFCQRQFHSRRLFRIGASRQDYTHLPHREFE